MFDPNLSWREERSSGQRTWTAKKQTESRVYTFEIQEQQRGGYGVHLSRDSHHIDCLPDDLKDSLGQVPIASVTGLLSERGKPVMMETLGEAIAYAYGLWHGIALDLTL